MYQCACRHTLFGMHINWFSYATKFIIKFTTKEFTKFTIKFTTVCDMVFTLSNANC